MLVVVLVVVDRAIRLTTVVFTDMVCTAKKIKRVSGVRKKRESATYDTQIEDNRSHRCGFRGNV